MQEWRHELTLQLLVLQDTRQTSRALLQDGCSRPALGVEHANVLGVHAVVALIVSIIALRLIRRVCVTPAGFLAGAREHFCGASHAVIWCAGAWWLVPDSGHCVAKPEPFSGRSRPARPRRLPNLLKIKAFRRSNLLGPASD
jgi:hypothetical protein